MTIPPIIIETLAIAGAVAIFREAFNAWQSRHHRAIVTVRARTFKDLRSALRALSESDQIKPGGLYEYEEPKP